MNPVVRIAWVLLAGVLMTSCVSTADRESNRSAPAARAQIERRLQEVFSAAAAKDFERLDSYHLYGPRFTKFGAEAPGRQDAETAKRGEHTGLAAINGLSMQADDLQLDLFDHTSIATFILTYRFNGPAGAIEKKARGTLVFFNDHGFMENHARTFLAVSIAVTTNW
jgi:hypothetical protein